MNKKGKILLCMDVGSRHAQQFYFVVDFQKTEVQKKLHPKEKPEFKESWTLCERENEERHLQKTAKK